MSSLPDLSAQLARAVETAAASIVRVEARRRRPSTGTIWSPDGLIVTAHHAVEREDGITVALNGSTAAARLVGRDPGTDLAVLKVEATGLTPADWASEPALQVGHLVLAAARPGRTVRATLGIISALAEGWRTPSGGQLDRYLETDADLPPGFSGGPLLAAGGGVLGVNTSGLLRGHALTVPGTTVRRVVESILAHGSVRRGYLGVGAYPIRLQGASARVAEAEAALQLVSIEPDGPADRAGLLLGDTLLALDDTPMRDLDDLLGFLTEDRVGTPVKARLLRAGTRGEIEVTVGERP